MVLRQPIVAVMGHVDHGKTSILDAIRETNVAKKEAGAITQHIGASEILLDAIRETCCTVVQKSRFHITIPGLLFIDTPGHESFTHLRERGGSIADIAVLVIDITQGIQPQTVESIKILREFKTPFVVAANKVDLISGWKKPMNDSGACGIIHDINSQRAETQAKLDEMIYRVVGRLSEFGMESERFDRIEDYTRQVAIVPVSAKTREGLPELLLSVAGLSQKFLEKELNTDADTPAKGSILEVKEEKGLGTTIDVIIYDGTIRKNDEIIFGTLNGSAKTRVRGIFKPRLKVSGDGDKYENVDEVHAAAGVKIYAPGLERALSGSPLLVDDGNPDTDQLKEIEDMMKGILLDSDNTGLILKADTIGSLEALKKLLSENKVEARRAGIGRVTKKDVLDASVVAASDKYNGVVLAFNVETADDAEEEAAKGGIRVFSSKVIYNLCDDYYAWIEEEKKKASGAAIERLPLPAKLLVLPGCTFRSCKPAIFGVQVVSGKLRKGVRIMDRNGEVVGEVREMQKEGKNISEAKTGEQIAVSVEGAMCGKSFAEGDSLYSFITRKQGEELISFCGSELSADEKAALEEILGITGKRLI